MLDPTERYEFGANWQRYLQSSFSEDRLEIARRHLLGLLKLERMDGKTFLDIGSGSGIHSLAAWRSGAARVLSFDYDPQSVAATRSLWAMAGSPANWEVRQGSVLDDAFMCGLGQFDIVYSWGVLHHTGDQWRAFANAAGRVAAAGRFYVALYSSDVHIDPSPEQWLAVKRRYNAAGPLIRFAMECRHIWATECRRSVLNLLRLPAIAHAYRASRGMALWADARDWLGGWPMEFSSVAEVMERADGMGFDPVGISFGEWNTEFLLAPKGAAEPLAKAHWAPPPLLKRLNDLPERPFFIFGTARGAELMVERLRRQGGPELAGFIDIERNGTFLGKPVVSPTEFTATHPADTPVVLSNRYVLQNAARLRAGGHQAIWNGHPLVISINFRGP